MRFLNVCFYVILVLEIQMKQRSGWSSLLLLFSLAQQPLVCQGVRIIEASLSHSDTPQSSGLFLDEWSVRRSVFYLTPHDSHKKQTSIRMAGFKPATVANERPQIYVLDHVATGIGSYFVYPSQLRCWALKSSLRFQWMSWWLTWEWHFTRIMSPIKVLQRKGED
jgi:hypothetical protein